MKKVKLRNKKYVYSALAVLVALLILIMMIPSGKKAPSRRISGINAVLTNEMSDTASLSKLDRDIRTFMQRWQIRGLELCITRNDSLIYAKGYGKADDDDEDGMEHAGSIEAEGGHKELPRHGEDRMKHIYR